MKTIRNWIIGIVAILITVYIARAIDLTLEWKSVWGMVIFVPVLGLTSIVVKPLLWLLSLPITLVTLGLFSFIINAVVFWLAGAATSAKMNFLSALFGSVVYTLIAGSLGGILKGRD